MDDKLVVFKGKEIRRVIHDDEWYFSVVDIIAALTDSANPRNYWNMMKNRVKKTSGVELYTFCVQLKLPASDGKTRCFRPEFSSRNKTKKVTGEKRY